MNTENPDDVLADLEGKSGCASAAFPPSRLRLHAPGFTLKILSPKGPKSYAIQAEERGIVRVIALLWYLVAIFK